jgi:nitroreductase
MLNRRSVRAFSEKPLDADALDAILQAAVSAPSGKNQRTWRFTALKHQALIEELAGRCRTALAARGEKLYGFYKPVCVILASNDRENPNGLADCACALENVFLAAASLGIGSCWINGLKYICDEPEIRAFLDGLGLPSSHIVWGAASLGYPKVLSHSPPRPPDREAVRIIEEAFHV